MSKYKLGVLCMAFTSEDCMREVILKLMIALAWREQSFRKESHESIFHWMKVLEIEGPEKIWITNMLSHPVHKAQIEILLKELYALLIFPQNRTILRKILYRTMRKKHHIKRKSFLEIELFAKVREMIHSLETDGSKIHSYYCKKRLS